MKLGIRGKLFLLCLVFVAVIDLVAGVVLEHQLRDAFEDRITEELARNVQGARSALELAGVDAKLGAVDPIADRLGEAMDARITVVAPDGSVLGDSALSLDEVATMEPHGGRPEVVAALAHGEGRSERYSTTLGRQMTYVAVPFGQDGSVVRVGLSMDAVDDAVAGVRTIIIVTGIAALLGAALLAALASHLFSKGLRSLVATAHAIATKRADVTRLPEEPSDEIGGLAGSFNHLADELERAMATMARERDRHETVLETMDQAVIALDSNLKLTMVNRRARALLELQETFIGRSLLDYVRVPELRDLVATAKDGKPAHAEFDYGKMPRLRIRAQASRQSSGGVVVVMHDMTEIRRLEMIRKDFVANVSHELRTPVAVIRANTETLMAGAMKDPERAMVFVEALHRHADRLGRLVGDLLDISRIEAGRYPLSLEPIELGSAVDRAIESLSTQAAARRLRVYRGFDGDAWVRADDKALEQVLVNLISNAIKYSDGGESVEVTLGAGDDPVRIEIRDDGPGIDPKHHQRVFERFYRVDSGRARDKGGTGLGLAIVKHLVEAMGGQVGVDARRPRGSVFWFALPSAAPIEEQLPLALSSTDDQAANA